MYIKKTSLMISALLFSLSGMSQAEQLSTQQIELTKRTDEVAAQRMINHPDPIELKVLHNLYLRTHT